jgi:hypothetical protein
MYNKEETVDEEKKQIYLAHKAYTDQPTISAGKRRTKSISTGSQNKTTFLPWVVSVQNREGN